MPTTLSTLRQTGAVIIKHSCDKCGVDCNFGTGLFLRKALNAYDSKKPEMGKELLGKAYCYQCLMEVKK